MKSKKQTKINNKKVSFLSLPSTKLSIIFSILSACILIAVAITLPLILNYPPNSINTPFDIEMSGIPYVAQFACIELIALIVICFVIKKVFKPIDEWYKNKDDLKYNNSRNIDTTNLNGGYQSLSYNGIPLVSDRFVPDGTMYLLNTNDFVMHQLCDWEWLCNEDGSILKQKEGYARYFATLVKYAELVCNKPGSQCMLTKLA